MLSTLGRASTYSRLITSRLAVVVMTLSAAPAIAVAQAVAAGAPVEPYVVEYYYKVRWGHQREFIDLFRKNHFPVLQRQVEKGSIVQVTAVAPRYHGTEDGRWDYRVTIVFRSSMAAHDPAASLTQEEIKKIFPDQATFEKEEQRRFEILEAHWDLPLVTVSLKR